MNKKNISDIISEIDDKFLQEASSVSVRKKSNIIKFAGIAACLTVVIAAAALLFNSPFMKPATELGTSAAGSASGDKSQDENVTTPAINYESEEIGEIVPELDMMIAPRWDDLTTSEKYTEVFIGDKPYASQVITIEDLYIDKFITDAIMSGYDIYEDKTYTIDAKVYSIKNISSECAVAVKIGDEDAFYVFVNVWYTPETLGDFMDDIDIKNTVNFGKAYIDIYEYSELSTSHTNIIYADFDDAVIWDMLDAVKDAEYTEYNKPYDRIGVETNIPLLGYKNISFCITPDGYIITNILSTQKCFYIGEDKFDYFDNYLKDNIPSKATNEVHEIAPDGAIPGKGEDTSELVTPGYDPNNPDAYSGIDSKSLAPYICYDSIVVAEETTKIS